MYLAGHIFCLRGPNLARGPQFADLALMYTIEFGNLACMIYLKTLKDIIELCNLYVNFS